MGALLAPRVRRFAPEISEILPHNTRAGALRAPHVQISPVGALRAPHFWRCAPGIFPHTSPAGALRAPHIQISPVTALRACGAHRQVLYHYLDHEKRVYERSIIIQRLRRELLISRWLIS